MQFMQTLPKLKDEAASSELRSSFSALYGAELPFGNVDKALQKAFKHAGVEPIPEFHLNAGGAVVPPCRVLSVSSAASCRNQCILRFSGTPLRLFGFAFSASPATSSASSTAIDRSAAHGVCRRHGSSENRNRSQNPPSN